MGWCRPCVEQHGSTRFKGSERATNCPPTPAPYTGPGDKERGSEDLVSTVCGGGGEMTIWVSMTGVPTGEMCPHLMEVGGAIRGTWMLGGRNQLGSVTQSVS